MPSAAYVQSVIEQTAFHARSKTFSGSLLEPHLPLVDDMRRRNSCLTVLDYGCGKAKCWAPPADGSKTLQLRMGIGGLTLYDPCVPGFDDERLVDGGQSYDLVLLSHVLFWIPLEDLREWVLPRIFRLARKAVLVVETIGDEKKRILSDRDAYPRGLHATDWLELLLPYQRSGLETTLVTEYRLSNGRIASGEWQL